MFFKTFKKALWYIAPFKWFFLITIILSFVGNSISNFSSFALGKIIDSATILDWQLVFKYFILYLLIISIPIFLKRIRAFFELHTTDFNFYHFVQKNTLFKSLNLSLGQLKKEHSGFKQDVLRGGENSLDWFHYFIIDELLPILSSFSVALFGLYILNLKFFIVAFVFSFVYLLFGSYVNLKIKEPFKIQIEKRIERNKVYVDLLRSLFFIKFTNQKKAATRHLKRAQDGFQKQALKVWNSYHLRMLISDLLLLIYFCVFVYFAYFGLKNNQISIGELLPLFSWMMMVASSLSQFRNTQRRTLIEFSNLQKMIDMLDQKSDVYIEENPFPIKIFEGQIIFEEVSFDYQDGKQGALKSINFEIKKGEKIALVGRSGSGKTTIVSLLLRLYDPTSGTILIDGVDLKSLVLEDWHDLLAYVEQDGALLDISIKDNILFGTKHEVTENEINSVLEKAGIKEFIANLPQGIDTIVGERGVKLSGGQKQRVCIARALIKDAPILLLDEATSSLDSETESIVNKAIWDMLGDKTGVVIAHRLSTIIDADKIIVMDHGEIVGIGTHKELIKTTPYYKRLVDAQNVNL